MAEPYAADLTGAAWYKSSYTAGNGNCVEVAQLPGTEVTAIRDSKDTHIPAARVSNHAWAAFVTAVAAGSIQR